MNNRSDPWHLSDYLLGADHSGPGLLRRVGEKVKELTEGYLPRYKTGSVMGMTDLKHESESIADSPVMDLAVALLEWKGGREASSALARRGFAAYLAKERITDADIVMGSDKVGKGLLYQIRHEVKILLMEVRDDEVTQHRNLSEGVSRCLALAQMLREWLDSECVHVASQLPTDDPRIVVLECAKCGCRLNEREAG